MEFTVAIAGGMKRKGGGSLKLSDFLPEFAKEVRKQSSPEESEARLKAAMFKAATIKKPDGKEQ